ncbi:unnamed protein product [Urochloa decumbens]|uniref:Uncharacterized protein n=1 Tax=Urochloa decumbens TaxID=240449 RepID=A0ABC9DWE3_9POAL
MAEKMSKPAAPLAVVSMDKDSSSPLPASSMDDKKQPPRFSVVLDVNPSPPPPPVPMVKKDKPPAVMMVCLWALLNAVIFAGCSIADLIMNRKPCTSSTWWSRCVELTEAAAAEASALVRGELWCSLPQAAAAAVAVALLLTGRRRRSRSRCSWAWALAVVALAATAASHYMEGRVDRIFLAAAPGDAYITTDIVLGFVFALLDLIGFLCLLILGDGHDE